MGPKLVRERVANCEAGAEIVAALGEAMGVLDSLNARILGAALEGDLDGLDAASAGLRQARDCEDNLLYAYCQHRQKHGCETPKSPSTQLSHTTLIPAERRKSIKFPRA